MRHPYFELPGPLVLGHRGAAGEVPENTLLSFERALRLGAHILESDIQCSADGVPVLAHDPEVDRVSDGSGAIAEYSHRELQHLDAGYRFTLDDASFPFRGQGLVIPTLEEAFLRFPAARFNLEVKAQAATEATALLVERYDRADRTLLVAADDDAMVALLEAIARRALEPAIGASTGDVLRFVRSAQTGSAPAPETMALQIPTEFAGSPLITPELLDHAHAHQLQVHAWTINDEAEAQRLLDLGVDGLVTDFPGRMRGLIARRRDP